MWVVKIGGSLYDSPRLLDWLRELADDPSPVVIVPGGGPFADQVRSAQRRWPISDASAHRMALLAMDQFGELCCALDDRWRRFSNPLALRAGHNEGDKWIWFPSHADPEVEHNWRITSDSLAAWLAAELPADGLALIKSAAVQGATPLFADGGSPSLLDGGFAYFRSRLSCPIWLVHRDDYRSWHELSGWDDGGTAGSQVMQFARRI